MNGWKLKIVGFGLYWMKTLSLYIVRFEKGYGLGELHDLMLGGKLSIQGLRNVSSLSEARHANLIVKKTSKNYACHGTTMVKLRHLLLMLNKYLKGFNLT